MPKFQMKDTGLKTIGGRIRKARTDAFMNIKELSEKIEVSFAYLGMVERGERNPSDKMLACIANVTGVSTAWLKEGDTPQDLVFVDTERIDVSLFLSLILHEVPELSPQILSAILATDENELDSILRETNNYNPVWYAGCSTIAQRLDIPKFLGKLSEIASFLKKTEIQMLDYKLINVLRKALSEVFQDKFEFYSQDTQQSSRCPDIWSFANEPSKPTREFTFQQESTHARCRVTLYIPLAERYADRLPGIISSAVDTNGNDVDNIALVFSDRASFEKSKALIAESMEEPTTKCRAVKNIVVMFIDPDTLCVSVKFPEKIDKD